MLLTVVHGVVVLGGSEQVVLSGRVVKGQIIVRYAHPLHVGVHESSIDDERLTAQVHDDSRLRVRQVFFPELEFTQEVVVVQVRLQARRPRSHCHRGQQLKAISRQPMLGSNGEHGAGLHVV